MDKTDIPGTFNAGATLGPVNPEANASRCNGAGETNMARIWNKHKQFHPVREKSLQATEVAPTGAAFSNGADTPLKPHTNSLRGRRKVFVAMSGGVDSSVAALLLKQEGFDVRGVYMKEWVPPGIECAAGDERMMAARVAAHLDIPFAVWDFSEDYRQEVAEYMLREYAEGRTPNPDVMCNKKIKFGIFLKKALEAGADYIATGHYVQLANSQEQIDNSNGGHTPFAISYKLLESADSNKDQTYFLWTLTQDELLRCLFPIGNYTKPEVRALARKARLPSWDKKDSQGVCFTGKFDFAEFLRTQLPQRQGDILTTSGAKVGTHDGSSFYTVGQRHGISSGIMERRTGNPEQTDNRPMYVALKDAAANTIVMAEEEDPALYKKELIARDINWISGVPPKLPLQCESRIRYRQPLQVCTIEPAANSSMLKAASMRVVFLNAQRAVAPGQSVVFYEKGEMLGGGVIDIAY